MVSKTLVVALAAVSAPLALAQQTFEVAVGPGGEFVFTPSTVTAQAGDTINFSFHPKSHTVTQSTFDAPCEPLTGGFATEVVATTAEGDVQNQYVLPADYDGSPQWFHCAVGPHCSLGMVFAINPPATGNTFEAFEAAARGGAGNSSTSATPNPSSSGSAPNPSSSGGAAPNSSTGRPNGSNSGTAPAPSPSGDADGDQGAAVSVTLGKGVVGVVAGVVASLFAL